MGTFKTGKVTGIPIPGESLGAGRAFFVGNSTANSETVQGVDDATMYGINPNRPFATVDYATNQCVANRGDVVYIMEGHKENITSSASFAPDIAGVSYIGLGRGSLRPTFTGTTTASVTVVTADSIRISNCIFKAGTTATAVSPTLGLQLADKDIQIDNCQFTNAGSSSYYVTQLQLSANSSAGTATHNAKILDNEFLSVTGNSSGTTQAIKISNSSGFHAVAKNVEIINNSFNGAFTQAAIESHSSGSVYLYMKLNFNDFYNGVPAGAASAVSIRNAITGEAVRNNITCLASTDIFSDIFDPGSLLCVENYCGNTVDETAAISPATVASSC